MHIFYALIVSLCNVIVNGAFGSEWDRYGKRTDDNSRILLAATEVVKAGGL
jgi:hypothetical protein